MSKRRNRRPKDDPLAAAISLALVFAVWAFFGSSFWKSPYFIPILCAGALVIGSVGVGLMIILQLQKRGRQDDNVERPTRVLEYHPQSAWQRAMHDLFPDRNTGTLPASPLGLRATSLELLAANVYNRLGYEATHQGGANDGGVDVLLCQQGKPIGVVQCKQYSGAIGPNFVRELNGTTGVSLLGYLWSPSGFTEKAREAADHMPRIKLLGKSAILALVEQAYPEPSVAAAHPAPKVVIPASPLLSQSAITSVFARSLDTPPAAPTGDPLHLRSLLENSAKRLGLTLAQIYILAVIL